MSPLEIEILLHVYAISEPLRQFPILGEILQKFIDNDLIVPHDTRKCGYTTTARGEKLVEMLCATPLPVYADPRSL